MTRAQMENLLSSQEPVTVYSIAHVLRSGKIDQITGIPTFGRPGWVVRGELDGQYIQVNLSSKHVFAKRADAVRAARVVLESHARKYLRLAKGLV